MFVEPHEYAADPAIARPQRAIALALRHAGASVPTFLGSRKAPEGLSFRAAGRRIVFRLPPALSDAERRLLWAGLQQSVVGRLVSVESGAESFETAFLAQTLLRDGRTVAEHYLKAIDAHLRPGAKPVPTPLEDCA